jgi:hypothetical protein
MESIASINQQLVYQREEFTSRDSELETKLNFVKGLVINKVDCDLFDDEINNIKAAITALST